MLRVLITPLKCSLLVILITQLSTFLICVFLQMNLHILQLFKICQISLDGFKLYITPAEWLLIFMGHQTSIKNL